VGEKKTLALGQGGVTFKKGKVFLDQQKKGKRVLGPPPEGKKLFPHYF